MHRPLIITLVERRAIARVLSFANSHPFPLARVRRVMAREEPFPGLIPDHRVMLPCGYGVVFSVEQHPEPVGWVKHISVGIHSAPPVGPDHAPNPVAVRAIAAEFGMVRPWDECQVYLEGEGGAVVAINVVEKIDPIAGGWG
jgi:hypothetical protein